MLAAVQNPNGSIAVVIFNEEKQSKQFSLSLDGKSTDIEISGQAIQTIVVTN
jgi:glucosylceramidase